MKMRKKSQEGLAMPDGVRTYISMFHPQQVEIAVETLVPMQENEEIHGPLLFDDRHHLLTDSFKMFGQNKPLIVYPRKKDSYWIIDGVRGWHAGKAARFTHLSCLVLDVDKQRAFEIMQILNSGGRHVTYKMKAKKLELLDKHAKQYLKETAAGDNEASDLTVRQFIGTILGMSERYVTEFKAVCAHEDSDILLDNMDTKLMTLNQASNVARNRTAKPSINKGEIPLGKKDELACEDCPRRRKFQALIEDYGDGQAVATKEERGGTQ